MITFANILQYDKNIFCNIKTKKVRKIANSAKNTPDVMPGHEVIAYIVKVNK